MLSEFSSAREAFTADDVELFVGRLRDPSRARADSALYRHFIQPEAARIMRGSYRGRRLSTPTRVLLGADDPNMRPEFIHGVEDHIDALDTQIVAGASHFIVDDVPGVVVAQALDLFTPERERALRAADHGHPCRRPRACYGPDTSAAMARWRKRQAKATKCSPATVAGNLS
jgi:hypothetical protein